MKSKLSIKIFGILILLVMINNTSAQVVTQHDGEYATDLTTFEYELTNANDPGGWLEFYWGFNTTGDIIRFEIGTSVLSEDYVDVFYEDVYKIPIDIYLNDEEFDVNLNESLFDYWEGIFWSRMILPIEDGQYNNFDVLEDQDPASYDVKGDEVSYFTAESELVYDYNSGILLSWTSTISYDFTLFYIVPPQVPSDTLSEDGNGFRDRLPISFSMVFIGLTSLIVFRKWFSKNYKK